MTPDRHYRECELFDRACDLDPAAQRELVQRECADDAELETRVLALLERDRIPRVELDVSAVARLAQHPTARAPERLGPYRILGVLGRGGMGVVYRAEQDSPRRIVALKVIRSAYAGEETLLRFEHEARILGRLNHAGIAQIFEAGIVEGPRGLEPYLAMELVEGQPLVAYAVRHALSIDDRLDLLAHVCEAVHHAHEKGVVHRDLKPSNVLVGAAGAPKVLDFGVARVTGPEFEATSLRTSAGELIGTLPYMSPEQLEGRPERIDARSDVYALGVMAFELVSGRLPHDLTSLPVAAAARVVCERDAPRLGSIDGALRGEIETIVAKALEHDRDRRYASARELADDLRRYLCHEPIAALPASGLYHLKKFAQRNRALTASLVLAGLVLVSATAISTWKAREAEDAREHAEQMRQVAERRSDEARRSATRAALAGAIIAAEHGDVVTAQRLFESIDPAERRWEWRCRVGKIDARIASYESAEDLRAATFVPGCGEVVMIDAAGTITRWLPGTDEPASCVDLGTRLDGPAAFDPDARFVAGVVARPEASIALWDAATGELLAETTSAEPAPRAIALARDGASVAFGAARSFLWTLADPKAPSKLPATAATALAFSADGTRLASTYNHPRDGPGWFLDYDASSGLHGSARQSAAQTILGVALDEHGERAVLTYENKRAFLVDLGHRDPVSEFAGHLGQVLCAAFDPAHPRVASGSLDRTVRLWDAASGRQLAILPGAEGAVRQVAFTSDGTRVLARSDHGVAVWDTLCLGDDVLAGHESYVYDLAFLGHGARVVSASFDGGTCVWDASSRQRLWSSQMPRCRALSATPDGARLALAQAGRVALLDGDSMTTIRNLDLGSRAIVLDVDITREGRLVVGRTGAQVVLWDAESGERLRTWDCEGLTPFAAVAISHDGALVASHGRRGEVLVFDSVTGDELARLTGHHGAIEALEFSPDSALLASGGRDGIVRLWSTRTWNERAVLRGHTDRVYALAFSPDGTRVASGSNDTTIRMWDLATGEETALLTGHDDYVFGLEFSPDGSCLASASGDFTARMWDTVLRADRWRAAERMRVAREAVRARVERSLRELIEPARVAQALRDDGSLSPESREAAIQVLLQLARATAVSPSNGSSAR